MTKIDSVVLSPNYNAVKIDINNPQVKVPQPQQPAKKEECKTCTNPIYDYPKTSIYDSPKAEPKAKAEEVKPAEVKPEEPKAKVEDVKPEEVKPKAEEIKPEAPQVK